jgi:hypothetical protein
LLRYIRPFRILEQKGEVACQLELLERLAYVHDVFHVSHLKKCLRVLEEQLHMEDLKMQDDLTYMEQLVVNLDIANWFTHSQVVKICNVTWSHHTLDEATWEREDDLRAYTLIYLLAKPKILG